MLDIEWTPAAEQDLLRCQAFLVEVDLDAAVSAAAAIHRAAMRLRAFPELGRVGNVGNRFRNLVVPFGRNSYVIRYTIRSVPHPVIRITRVWHSRELRI